MFSKSFENFIGIFVMEVLDFVVLPIEVLLRRFEWYLVEEFKLLAVDFLFLFLFCGNKNKNKRKGFLCKFCIRIWWKYLSKIVKTMFLL